MAAQACLPFLEAEAKARQKLAGESTHSNQYKNVQLVPELAQAAVTPENPTMLPKNNIKSANTTMMVESGSDAVRLNCAKEILNRAGISQANPIGSDDLATLQLTRSLGSFG